MTNEDIRSAVSRLGKRFRDAKSHLSDFKLLSNPAYCQELIDVIASVRDELVDLEVAFRLDDGTIIIRSEYIVNFFEPGFERKQTGIFKQLDLDDPKVIEKVALTCGIKQWLFLADQIKDKARREKFLGSCARIVAEHGKRL